MTAAASSRGWGRGWPRNRVKEMAWVTAPSGAKWQVHREVAPILQRVINEAEQRGYKFDHGPADVNDDWGYANRPIRGSRTASNHSWGLAIDIDAQNYPQGQNRRRPPQWLIDLFAAYKWEWGGNWSYEDPMHFEFAGTLNDARRMVAMMNARPAPAAPAPPAPAPPPRRLPDRPTIRIGTTGRMIEIAQWELAMISGAQFPGEIGIYWGWMEQALKNLGRILSKNWDGHTLGPEQWEAIDFLYLSKGHEPVLT